MKEEVTEIATTLESYGTPRADFRQLSAQDRRAIARQLVIASSQLVEPEAEQWDDPDYRASMRRVRQNYMYECGKSNVDRDEARYIWNNVLYPQCSPHERRHLI